MVVLQEARQIVQSPENKGSLPSLGAALVLVVIVV